MAQSNPDPAERVLLLSKAVGIAPDEQLFRVLLLHVATASAANDAELELAAAAARLEAQAEQLADQAEATERARQPQALLRQHRSFLALSASLCVIIGIFFGVGVNAWLSGTLRSHVVIANPSLETAMRVLSSAEGKGILALITNGEAARLANCAGEGWKRAAGSCMPLAAKSSTGPDRVFGWRTAP